MWLLVLSMSHFWRLYLVTLALMCVGWLLGILSRIHFSMLLNAVMGGSLLGSLGFVIGLFWQFWSRERRKQISWGVFLYTCVLLGSGTFAGLLLGTPLILHEVRTLSYIRNLRAADLRYIDVFRSYGGAKLKRLDDPAALKEFAQALRDVRGLAGFPRDIQRRRYFYLVVVARDRTLRLECQYEIEGGSPAVCGTVFRSGKVTWYGCHMMSVSLREWFEKYVRSP